VSLRHHSACVDKGRSGHRVDGNREAQMDDENDMRRMPLRQVAAHGQNKRLQGSVCAQVVDEQLVMGDIRIRQERPRQQVLPHGARILRGSRRRREVNIVLCLPWNVELEARQGEVGPAVHDERGWPAEKSPIGH